jgi:UDP-glucose 4-epimerase
MSYRHVGVTGAAGFVGSNLCRRLVEQGVRVVGVDDLSRGSLGNLGPCLDSGLFRFEQLDCTRRHDLREVFSGCDSIVHLAAQKIPRYEGTLMTLEANVAGVNAACYAALSLDCDLVITSTSDVYGNAPTPLVEDGPLVLGPPTSRRWAYAVSKMFDEHVALALAAERGLRVTILRLFNAYGPHNHLSWWGGPVVTFTEALLDGQPLEIHGDGRQTRTFTYIGDTVDGIVRTLATPAARGEVINIGGTETVTILELATRIHRALGLHDRSLAVKFVAYHELPGNYQDVRHRVPDTTKARQLLDFEAQIGLDEGLRATLDWHRSLREVPALEEAYSA